MKFSLRLPGLWSDSTQRSTRSAGGNGKADEHLVLQLHDAHRKWQLAQQYFHAVCDPNQVDDAIIAVDTARRTYAELFRQIRESQGYSVSREEPPWT